jgi:predicted nuclease of predicted toxin-antitoxin system
MRFKVDENLPVEIAEDLRLLGHAADTVAEEGLAGAADSQVVELARLERRVLLTLDKGIASLLSYPPQTHAWIVLFRPGSLGRRSVLEFVRSRMSQVLETGLESHLAVVTGTRIRIR